MNNTLSVASFNLILHAAQQKGADYELLCQRAGLRPEMLQNPDARLPISQVQTLWKEAVELTGDNYLALSLGESINTMSIGILAYVMMHCPTLGKALEKLCQYQDIVCDASKTSVTIQGEKATLSLVQLSEQIRFPRYAYESELSIYYQASKQMTDKVFHLQEVHFNYPSPSEDIRIYQRIFETEHIVFNSDITGFVFDKKFLETPILNANPNLFTLFEAHADTILHQLKNDNAIQDRIKKEILQGLKGEEPTLASIAKNIGMGIRSIQLKLKEEGVTFQQLLDVIRKDLAVKHLMEARLSTTDIAYLLGYSDPSVFFRSFKKWTGQTPAVYRKERLQNLVYA
jgi:AraC-like DNA-binding protein